MCHCERAMELISLQLDGMLTPEEGRALEQHLDHCPSCGSLARELEELQRFMPQEEPVPEGFHAGVMDRVRREKVVPLAAARPKKTYQPWKSLGAMAAVFAVVLAGTGTFRHFTQLSTGETMGAQSAPVVANQPEQDDVLGQADKGGAVCPTGGPEVQSLDGMEEGTVESAPAGAGTGAAPETHQAQMDQEPAAVRKAVPAAPPSETTQPEAAPQVAARTAVEPAGMETEAPSVAVEPSETDSAGTEPAPAEAGVSPQMAHFSMDVNLAEGAGESSAPEAVEQAVLWLAESHLERKDQIDVTQADVAVITEEELALVLCLEGAEGLLDSSDWMITLGDTAGPDWVRVVCDRESDQVIGYLNQA